MIELQVPAAVLRGEPVILNCTFDLEGDVLYSIKWYKNNVEFYRHLASDNPPGKKYSLQGIHLDYENVRKLHLWRSVLRPVEPLSFTPELLNVYGCNVTTSRGSMDSFFQPHFKHGPSVRMNETDLLSEGSYRCEVSAEAPSFQTVVDEKELRVYVLPDGGPTILGAKAKYQINDDVNVTCMSGPSKPPSFLQWYVNGKEVPTQYISRLNPLIHANGLQSSRLGLRFMVQPEHFWKGAMKLRCTAFISKAYSTSRSEIVATNKAKIADQNTALNRGGPTITGGRLRYQEGNVVNINCTAMKAHPPAELRWYINDKEANRDYLRPYPPLRFPDSQEATVLGVRFTVKAKHFQRGEMRLKCTATLFKVTDMKSEEMVISNRQQSSGLHVYINRGNALNKGTTIKDEFLLPTILFLLLLICFR